MYPHAKPKTGTSKEIHPYKKVNSATIKISTPLKDCHNSLMRSNLVVGTPADFALDTIAEYKSDKYINVTVVIGIMFPKFSPNQIHAA